MRREGGREGGREGRRHCYVNESKRTSPGRLRAEADSSGGGSAAARNEGRRTERARSKKAKKSSSKSTAARTAQREREREPPFQSILWRGKAFHPPTCDTRPPAPAAAALAKTIS